MVKYSDKAWSPYVAGVIIGLLQIPAFLLVDTALGASTSFAMVAGEIASLFDPAVSQSGYFAKYMGVDKYYWQTALVIGVAVGAWASARASGAKRKAFSPIWTRAAGITALGPRLVMAFAGGFVLLFGARLAGGCTSGHGLSGSAQLAVASLVAVVAMFAGGIVTAKFFRKV